MSPVRDHKVMFYVYILKSKKNDRWYTGSTNDLRKRFKRHNENKSSYTKNKGPWELIYYESSFFVFLLDPGFSFLNHGHFWQCPCPASLQLFFIRWGTNQHSRPISFKKTTHLSLIRGGQSRNSQQFWADVLFCFFICLAIKFWVEFFKPIAIPAMYQFLFYFWTMRVGGECSCDEPAFFARISCIGWAFLSDFNTAVLEFPAIFRFHFSFCFHNPNIYYCCIYVNIMLCGEGNKKIKPCLIFYFLGFLVFFISL